MVKISLRTALVAMLLLATVPLAALMCFQLLDKARDEQKRMRNDLDREALVLAQTVENELVASIEALRILGMSESLRIGDVRQFERTLAGRGALRAGWQGSFLTDTRGMVLFDTTKAAGRGIAAPVPGFREMLWTLTPMVSGLVSHQPDGPLATVIAVPVVIDGELRFGLGVWVSWAAWQMLLKRSTPSEGVSVLLDRERRVIARSAGSQGAIGAVLDDGPLLEAGRYDSVMPLSVAGWSVRRAVAAAPLMAAQWRSMALAALTAGACMLFGVAMALLLARRVTRPLELLARDGGARTLNSTVHVREIAALRDALQAASERDQAARDGLRRKADEFETLFSSSPIGLAFAQDRECRNVLSNAAMGHLFGRNGDEVPAVFHAGKVLPPAQMPLSVAARTGQAVAMMELEFRFIGRRVVHAMANAVPLRDAQGRPRGAIAVLVDITARKEMEAQLYDAHEQLKDASRAKDEFLAMLGHELRNPLSAVTSAVEVLSRDETPKEMAATACEIIARQTLHLSRMMGDLLDVTRVASGKVMLARETLDLAPLVQRAVDTLALTGETDGHRVSTSLQQAWAEVDPTRIEQVVTNLVGNAVKYTAPGCEVRVVLHSMGDEAVLQVADDGNGIAAELLPRVFDLFVQGERTLDRRAGGLGIGLTLVKRLADLHGGNVHATSSSSGTVMEVRLPLAASRRELTSSVPHRPASVPSLKVLVVEDNVDALRSMSDLLGLEGHVVLEEWDGRSGLSTLLAEWPDVAIVDIGLPGLDGHQLAKRARGRGYAGRMIAVSGYGLPEDTRRAMKAGFDVHVVKPVEARQLRELVGEASALSSGARA